MVILTIAAGAFITIYFLDGQIVGWIVVAYVVLRGRLQSPPMVVYDDGIEVQQLAGKKFFTWKAIHRVRVERSNSYIFPKGLSPAVRFLFYDSWIIMRWRKNYQAAMAVVEKNVQQSSKHKKRRPN